MNDQAEDRELKRQELQFQRDKFEQEMQYKREELYERRQERKEREAQMQRTMDVLLLLAKKNND